MIGKLKMLGLAAFSALAASAVIASAAQAEGEFTASAYPATVESGLVGQPYKFTFGAHQVSCNDVAFKYEAKASSKAVTQVPVRIRGCTWLFLGMKTPATIVMNNCDWVYPDASKPKKSLKCEAGKDVEIHGFTSQKTEEEGKPLCTWDLAEQSELGSVSFENVKGSPEDVLVKETLSGIVYTVTGTKLNCGSSGSSGEASAQWTMTAKNEKGEAVAFMIG